MTGTRDRDYDLLWFVENCLDNALRLDIYISDADRSGDSELADLFRRACCGNDCMPDPARRYCLDPDLRPALVDQISTS